MEKIKAAILNSKLYDTSPVPFEIIDDFTQAVLAAARAAEDGDIVLLSPACASFDHYSCFSGICIVFIGNRIIFSFSQFCTAYFNLQVRKSMWCTIVSLGI